VVDFDSLVNGPVTDTFGVPVVYTPAGGASRTITATFFEGYLAVEPGYGPPAQSSNPILGVQLSQLPAGYDAEAAQDDLVTVNGKDYVVKSGQPDGNGWAKLELQRAP
jgi:hypothetical protein